MSLVETANRVVDAVRPAKQKTLSKISERARTLTAQKPNYEGSRSTTLITPDSKLTVITRDGSGTGFDSGFETELIEDKPGGGEKGMRVIVNSFESKRHGIIRFLTGTNTGGVFGTVLFGSERTAQRVRDRYPI